jgi:hypothetical protein
MSERQRAWVVERDGAVAGGPDGPVPVQRGDVVVVVVCKNWGEAATQIASIGGKRDPR